jgi:hypothetical protein
MTTAISTFFILLVFASSTVAQKNKPWTEWSQKEVEKTLSDSAWSQTQTEGGQSRPPESTSAITATTAARREDSNMTAATKVESGEVKAALTVKYHVRFLSAKPVRAAFARTVMLKQAQPNASLTDQLQGFIDRSFSDWIVISVGVEVGDEKMAMAITRAFSAETSETLKQHVYLERKDGKKLFLLEYRAPAEDGMGAKFVFQRVADGQPFLSENDSVRFVAQFNEKMKLSTKYKLSDMLYDGKLEY